MAQPCGFALVLKTGRRANLVSGVRIPPLPLFRQPSTRFFAGLARVVARAVSFLAQPCGFALVLKAVFGVSSDEGSNPSPSVLPPPFCCNHTPPPPFGAARRHASPATCWLRTATRCRRRPPRAAGVAARAVTSSVRETLRAPSAKIGADLARRRAAPSTRGGLIQAYSTPIGRAETKYAKSGGVHIAYQVFETAFHTPHGLGECARDLLFECL